MTDSFFGFDTDLSAIGSLELEDGPEEVDEYNDETFGTEADVWQEESHELAAELLERERQRHLPANSHTSSLTAPPPAAAATAAAVEPMGADRLANKLCRLPVLSESELLSTTGSLTHSVPLAAVSPARAPAPTLFPAPFSVSPALPATAKVRTVAELERDMMLADSVDKLTCSTSSAPVPQPPPPAAQLPPPPQPQLPPPPTAAAAAVHSLASSLGCVLPDLTRPPPSLPAPFCLPTGSPGGVTNMRAPAMAVRQPPLAAADPFRGLMTNKDRQWLLNIQRLQVQSNDDYYFKHFKTRKLRGLLASGVTANNNNNSSNGGGGGGGGVLHEKNGERTTVHLEKRDYVPPVIENTLGKLRVASVTAPRRIIDVHAPADEDGDGRTVDCRRETKRDRLILLTIEQLYVDLLTVEHDECDAATADNNNSTHTSAAAAASNNNNNSCSVDTSAVARPDEAAGNCQQQEDQQQQEEEEEKRVTSRRCWSRLVAALHDRDTLAAILCVAKGKKLMLRVLAHVPHSTRYLHQHPQQHHHQQQLELEQLLVATLYAHLSRCVVKDRCSLLLHNYYHLVQTVLDRADLAQLNQYAADLSTDLDVSTLSVSSASPFCSLVSSSFGVSAVVSLLLCGQQLYQDTDPTSSTSATSSASSAPCHRSVWSGLFTRLVTALNVVSQRVAPPLRSFSGPLLSARLPLSRHLLVTLSAAD